ncbi:2'-5' RNA ligase family protein [Bordetella genomosp. 13]|uniref:2'-5' RNA ligase family protein n=1 Tax=Bordetella genomosp. 13 TaxID=463040 RepID=UPI0011A3DD09|nr:2'-5' RNA ligase family protein [Bordetella genomosp. 13]
MTVSTSRPDPRDTLRIFFALWPEGRARDALAPWQQRAHAHCGGRPMRPDTLHLTLAFLGEATRAQAETLIAHTRQDRIEPGELLLSRYGTFPRQGIVHACPDAAVSGGDRPRVETSGVDTADVDTADVDTADVDTAGVATHDTPSPGIHAMHTLNDRLWTALQALGWQREARPFRPHVTLLRKADCASLPEPPAEPVLWAYRHYVLVSSEPSMGTAQYRVLARSGESDA